MKKNTKKMAAILSILSIITIGSTYIANASLLFKPNYSSTQQEKMITLTPTFITKNNIKIQEKNINLKTPNYEINIKLPVITELKNKEAEAKINSKIEKLINNYKNQIVSGADKFAKEVKKQGWPMRQFVLVSDYEIYNNDENILSFTITVYSYTGGAHGMTEKFAFNIDMQSGKELALKDLFKESFDYKTELTKEINKQIAEDNAKPIDDKTKFMFFQDAKANLCKSQYYIDNKNLVIYFPLYELAPYSSGIPSFKIPLDSLKDNLNESLYSK
ncbi:DUF3298 and DUF4163 domain-containing protein [Clostridium aestuarii]|uniref:DUF3298 and DUF4163 domain-containing protein n=1 Tax=Clostridium aestuarii TaxID=338193 RepID=A0ABT4D3S2_9CLOT|nr:DUF3298 and DUF4163 domain-containing protein [Clostridium aestuarii]MCY6485883.1 DUF3298 and DUF4163 domain-containing protein [Clostridium aestuarii]